MKTCTKCKVEKDEGEFHKNSHTASGLQYRCKTCSKEDYYAWRAKNRDRDRRNGRNWEANHVDKIRNKQLKRYYGIDLSERNRLSALQGDLCAICCTPDPGFPNTLHVDHDHRTNTIRGLLCGSCNRGLGMFQDDPARLRVAAEYLDRKRVA